MLYTVAAAAKATGLRELTIFGAIESGQITGTRVSPGVWEIEHSDLHRLYVTVGEPRIGAAGAQQNAEPDATNLEAEVADRIRNAEDSLRQSFDEGHSEPNDGRYQAQALRRPFAGPMHAPGSVASPQAQEVISPLSTMLVALAALGLCWICGWGSYLFVGFPASISLKQNFNSSSPVLSSKDGRIGNTGGRDTKSGVQTTTTAPQPGHARVSQDLTQSATTLTDLISSVAVQQPGKTSSKPLAVPETRPTTIEGWAVRDVADGKAVLEGPNGIWKVARGDTVPGVGTVVSIVLWGNRWIVATSRGLITTQ